MTPALVFLLDHPVAVITGAVGVVLAACVVLAVAVENSLELDLGDDEDETC